MDLWTLCVCLCVVQSTSKDVNKICAYHNISFGAKHAFGMGKSFTCATSPVSLQLPRNPTKATYTQKNPPRTNTPEGGCCFAAQGYPARRQLQNNPHTLRAPVILGDGLLRAAVVDLDSNDDSTIFHVSIVFFMIDLLVLIFLPSLFHKIVALPKRERALLIAIVQTVAFPLFSLPFCSHSFNHDHERYYCTVWIVFVFCPVWCVCEASCPNWTKYLIIADGFSHCCCCCFVSSCGSRKTTVPRNANNWSVNVGGSGQIIIVREGECTCYEMKRY